MSQTRGDVVGEHAVAAESLGTRKVFTVDPKDFEAYRVRHGHRHYALEIVP